MRYLVILMLLCGCAQPPATDWNKIKFTEYVAKPSGYKSLDQIMKKEW
jgi:hypothetical protein